MPKNHKRALTDRATDIPPRSAQIVADPTAAPEPLPPTAYPDRIAAAEINAPESLSTMAEREGINKTTPYATARITDHTKKSVYAATLQLKKIARTRGYHLDMLVHQPDVLQDALDDFDLTCYDLGLYPLQHLLTVWLDTTNVQLTALVGAAQISQAGHMLAVHSDFCAAVISSAALQADKPPVFSIYYLKTAYKMFDDNTRSGSGLVTVAPGASAHITVNAADISKKSQLFAEIDADGEPK